MKEKLTSAILLALLPLILLAQEPERIRVFYLGGQSNMDGYGYNSELPESLAGEQENVWIFHGNIAADEDSTGGKGIWEELKPGHGNGFSSDGRLNQLSDRFGLELSFGKRMQELYPEEKIAIIKYSKGGTSIDSTASPGPGTWEPDYRGRTGMNQYDHFLSTVENALSQEDIDGDGREDLLIPAGIIWMQGESDADHSEAVAQQYYSNLKRLMDLMRATFRRGDLPVVIGKISDSGQRDHGKVWEYGELVQYAQEKFVKKDIHAAIVRTTINYGYSDPWHYDSEGYIDLGEQFANALFQLQKK